MRPYAAAPPTPGTPPTPPPRGIPPKDKPVVGGANAPDWIVFAGGLVIALAITEALYRVKPGAGWAFAAIVVGGYLASGDRLPKVMEWLQRIGWIQ